jgi:ribosomal protein S18 acetylase RimI-like enzyme
VRLAPVLILEDLFVEPEHRMHGVARSLIHAAVAYARETGAAAMFLETAVDNERAQRVYEREGWRREEQFHKYNAPL